ncbi:MAG TPA: HAMP domain-containing sensor histidine kinase [Patescibacteria group bacterium]
MQHFFTTLAPFTKTRLILSLWYSLILLLILIAFSIVLIVTYNSDVARIVLQQDFGSHFPRTLSQTELRLIAAQVRELRHTAFLDIIVIDIITLFIGAVLSYFLAGKTLSPIQKNMISQKYFVADASHELKSPITTIQTMCEVALRSKTRTKEEYKKVLEQVFDESQRLGRLVTDLLSLSVLDTGSSDTFKFLKLSTLVGKKLSAMEAQFKKANIMLERSISPNVILYADADKVEQLLIILLDNAIKFTPKGGKVMVNLNNKAQTQLIVEDTGIGIASEDRENIFKRFYQVEKSHSVTGAGLGLAIAQSIMQLHHGRITVTSTLGKGSRFTCIFPKNAFRKKRINKISL